MKKNLIYCAVAALALSSCMKDEVADVVSGSLETITFEAAASVESKTTLVDGKKVYISKSHSKEIMKHFSNFLGENL